jgi:hypothetical protein
MGLRVAVALQLGVIPTVLRGCLGRCLCDANDYGGAVLADCDAVHRFRICRAGSAPR